MMKKILFLLGLITFFTLAAEKTFAAYPWINDSRTMFISDKMIIYTINIRTFGAKDVNGNDLIEPELGETTGNFVNAVPKLSDILSSGANTVYLLPITKTGKLKALGTAGSLYAMDSFNTINTQLDDKKDPRDVFNEAKAFIREAHNKNLRVIIDMPSCGSYDLSLEKPSLFLTDKQGKTITPADWTDVRLFKVTNEDGSINQELLKNYKKFIDMALALGVDGVRADVAAIKPYEFWKELITYTRNLDPQFVFIAEANPLWTNPAKGYIEYESTEKLLDAGFDGYYGNWANFKDITKAKDFYKMVDSDQKILQKFNGQKSTLATFATHDQLSPLLVGGEEYWEMITWLNVTLPLNSYFLDGHLTGDTYLYAFENQKAKKTYTDDDQYFVHRGKMDIFNFSRPPKGSKTELKEKYLNALKFKYWAKNLVTEGKYKSLDAADPRVFAFARTNGTDAVVVIGNLDKKNKVQTNVYIPRLKQTSFVSPVKMIESPVTKNGKLEVQLEPYEIQVFMLSKVEIK